MKHLDPQQPLNSFCCARKNAERANLPLEVWNPTPGVDEVTMEELSKYDFSGLTPMILILILEFCRIAYHQKELPSKEKEEVHVVSDVYQYLRYLRYDEENKKAYISSELAIYVKRHWALPTKKELSGKPFCNVNDNDLPKMLDVNLYGGDLEKLVAGQEEPDLQTDDRIAIILDERCESCDILDECCESTNNLQEESATGIPPYYTMKLNGISTAILSLFVGRASVFDGEEGAGQGVSLSKIYPRFTVAPTDINCRELTDFRRVQCDDPAQPGIMETICGKTNMSMTAERLYFFPYWIQPEENRKAKIDDGSLVQPTFPCMKGKLNKVTSNGINQLRGVPLREECLAFAFENFFRTRFEATFVYENLLKSKCSSHQRAAILLGCVLQLLQNQLNGLQSDKDWLRLHRHCALRVNTEGAPLLPLPTSSRRVLYAQTMVMFAANWSQLSLAPLDGNNRITSAVNTLLKIYPQMSETSVITPREYPLSPDLSILGRGVDSVWVIPRTVDGTGNDAKRFDPHVFVHCGEYSTILQNSKYQANECTLKEWVSTFFRKELNKPLAERMIRWMLPELLEHPEKTNKEVNAKWFEDNIHGLVSHLKTTTLVIPPKLKTEVMQLEEEGGVFMHQKQKLSVIFPPWPKDHYRTHPNLPYLQTVIAICCYTPFYDTGNEDMDTLQVMNKFVRDGGNQGHAKVDDNFVRKLTTENHVFLPEKFAVSIVRVCYFLAETIERRSTIGR